MMKNDMAKPLTREQISKLAEVMQAHMDKSITYGHRSHILVDRIIRRSNFLATQMFPQTIAVLYPASNQPVVQKTIEILNEFGEDLMDWGGVLVQLGQEYQAMIDEIKEFTKKLPDDEDQQRH